LNKKLVNFIVKKYLRFDKKNPFISISAILAFVGVAIGVMVLILSMAIMNGTAKEFEKKLFTMNYPLTIYSKFSNSIDDSLLNKLEQKYPELKFSPYISSQVIAQSGEDMSGGMIFGVIPQKEASINEIYKKALGNLELEKYDYALFYFIKSYRIFNDSKNEKIYFPKLF